MICELPYQIVIKRWSVWQIVGIVLAFCILMMPTSALPHSVTLTSDDNYEPFCQNMTPILQKYNSSGIIVPFTMYVNSARPDNTSYIPNRYCTWAQLDNLYVNLGVEFGDHTFDHKDLANTTLVGQEYQIAKGRDDLIARNYTKGVYQFAYPFGSYNSETFTAMNNTGMVTGRTVIETEKTNITDFPWTTPTDLFKIKVRVLNQSGYNDTYLNLTEEQYILDADPQEAIVYLIHDVDAANNASGTIEYINGTVLDHIIEVALSNNVSIESMSHLYTDNQATVAQNRASASTGWLQQYQYRQKVHVAASPDGAQTNWVINFSLFNTTGTSSSINVYMGSKVSDPILFQDVRVTGPDGYTVLPSWNVTNASGIIGRSTGADIFVNTTTLLTSGSDTDLYFYYGNPSAAISYPQWSGNRVFPRFSDFVGTMLHTADTSGDGTRKTRWDPLGNKNYTINNSVMNVLTDGAASTTIITKADQTPLSYASNNNTKIIAKIKSKHFTTSTWQEFFFSRYGSHPVISNSVDKNVTTAQFARSGSGQQWYSSNFSISYGVTMGTNWTANTWHVITSIQNNSCVLWKTELNDTPTVICADHPTGMGEIGFQVGSHPLAEIDVDWIATMPWTLNPPTVGAWSAEESSPTFAQFTPTTVSKGWAPVSVAFTDTSYGYPVEWAWQFNNLAGNNTWITFSTAQNPTFYTNEGGNYSIRLNASTSTTYNISTQSTFVNVGSVFFTPNQTIGYQYPLSITFTKTNTTIIDTVNWSFGDTYTLQAFSPVQHIYTVAGNYTTYLNATNSTYGYSNISKTVELVTDNDIFLKSWMQFENATVTDLKGVAWTNSGCTLSTVAPKFGTQSLSCTDGNNYIYSPSSSIWDRSSIAGEMEFWINISAVGTAGKPIIKRSTGTDGTTNGWGFYEYNTSGYYAFWYGNAASNRTTPFYIPLNTQTHLVLLRNTSQYWEVYKDGVKINGGNYVGGLVLDTANQFQIGASGPGTEVSFKLDEFRYTQGIPRFVSDFSVPYAAYRGSLTGAIDTSPNSTYRYKTNPGSIAGIANQTNGGTRNRTVQVQNMSEANYLVGGGNFDPLHEQVKAVFINSTDYSDLVLESYSIDNVGGIVAYNVSRGGTNKITAPFDTRTNFLDVQVLYYNYTQTSDDFQYFAYGWIINNSVSFPVHNFIATPITYLTWEIFPNFTASSTLVPAGTPVTFTDATAGAPTGWTNYAWTFGDGGTATSRNPSYTYSTPGTYTVKLTTSLTANTSVTNSTTKVGYITVTSSGSGTPVASFTGSPLVSAANTTITFTDASTNSPVSWAWTFGDGTGSTLQNPTHQYITNGLYTVNLTATNAYGSNTLSRAAYINITSSAPSSFTQQDIWMAKSYVLTITVLSSSNGIAIPDVAVADSNGQNATTNTMGQVTFNEPYSTAAGSLIATGYVSRSWSIVVDNDTSVTYQMSPVTTSDYSSIQYTTPHNVKVTIRDVFSGPVAGIAVNATYVESSGPFDYLLAWLGVLSKSGASVQNTTLYGHTGDDGSVNFLMVESVQYNITAANQSMLIYPKDDDYTVWINGGLNATNFYQETCNPLEAVQVTVSAPKINSSFGFINVTYADIYNSTSFVKMYVNQSHNYGNKTNETTVFSANVTGSSSFTSVFNMTNPADQSYLVHANATTTKCGVIYRGYGVTFPPNPISMGLPEVLLPFIAMGLVIFVGLKFTRTLPGETLAAICFIAWVTYLAHWWDSQVDPVVFGSALVGFTVLTVIYNIALRSKKLPMQ